ncbi:hypothetical protein HETIRDRAFT_480361 [Heterobasidion irregulare TC 32-1]|uniref:Uncharacterized protein n=1 Tax=Heterobasidion irregulare (strain TC 32-1) TaxID=747525 RepID=W4JT83_HETIT|nr:uncharacterized protein HETIRDRAFT_480361 [Heterobasidion irregulare TC 32-1]ETW76290.1 hypothetical protein HETIRDRAFT_480361 [Heterobasidion irregulare TC 32-1]
MTPREAQQLQHAGSVILNNAIALSLQAFFYGVYTILIIFSTYHLVQKDMRSRANIIMLMATLVMFAVSTSHAALDMVILIQQFVSIFIGHPDLPLATRFIVANNAVIGYEIGQTYLYTINGILSDAVVVWRAWVLWQDNRKLVLAPLVLLLGSLCILCVQIGLQTASDLTDSIPPNALNKVRTSSWALSLATNTVATSLIGYKAWSHRRFLKANLSHGSRKTKVEKVLAILVETGLFYCLQQAIMIGMGYIPLPDNPRSPVSSVLNGVSVHLAGIYPTMIIVLVNFQRSIMDTPGVSLNVSGSGTMPIASHLSFATPPAMSARSDMLPKRGTVHFEPPERTGFGQEDLELGPAALEKSRTG